MTRRNNPSKPKAAEAKGGGSERRSRTVERREERQKERRRRRQMMILGVVAVIAVLAIIFIVLANQPAEAPIAAEAVAEYEGIPQSISDAGYPQLGNPDAPVRVVEYSSFDCPNCEVFHRNVVPAIVERVRAGEVLFTYAPIYGTGGIPNGQGAAKAALCAGYQDSFWTFHTALFTWQGLYANQAFTGQRLSSGIDNLGINKGEWNTCMGSSAPDETMQAAREELALEIGGVSTPTIVINGEVVEQSLTAVTQAIDVALATAPVSAPPSIELPPVETEEPEADETDEAEEVETEEAAPEEETATEEAAEDAATEEVADEVVTEESTQES